MRTLPLPLLLFHRMLALVFALQLGFQQSEKPRSVFLDAFDALDAVPQRRDLCGDCSALFLVLCKYCWIGLAPDLIANLAALCFQCGDLRFRLRNVPVQIVRRVQLVLPQKLSVRFDLRYIL